MSLVACSPEVADVTFTVQVPPTDQGMVTQVEALLQDATNVELVGTVTGRDEMVLVARYSENGEDCVGVFHPTSWTTGCGGIQPFDGQWIILQGGGGKSTSLLLATPPEATEIRVTTGDGQTYSAPTLDEYGYISFEPFAGSRVVSVWAGDEMIHEQ